MKRAALLLTLRRVGAGFSDRTRLVAGLALGAIAVHSLFYNAFFEDPVAWAALGLVPLAVAELARERVSEPRQRAGAPRPTAVAAPQAGRSRAEAG